jgi:hypothetical protein
MANNSEYLIAPDILAGWRKTNPPEQAQQPVISPWVGISRLLATIGQAASASDPTSWQNQLANSMIGITSAQQAGAIQKELEAGRSIPTSGIGMFGVTPQERQAALAEQMQRQQMALEQTRAQQAQQQIDLERQRTGFEGRKVEMEEKRLPYEIGATEADTAARKAYAASLPPYYKQFTQEEKLTNLRGWWQLQGDIVRANADLEKARGLEIPNITVDERKVLVRKLYDSIKDELPKEGIFGLSKPSVDELEKRLREGKIPDSLLPKVRALLAINNSFDIVAKNDLTARQVWMEIMLSTPGMYDELWKAPTTAKPSYPLSSKSSGVTRSF